MDNKNILARPYRILADFIPVYGFLRENYTPGEMNGDMLEAVILKIRENDEAVLKCIRNLTTAIKNNSVSTGNDNGNIDHK